MNAPAPSTPPGTGRDAAKLARRALFSFTLVFAFSRIVVFLIMDRKVPNLFLFLRGTHVHHLNYGIFLLAGVGGWLLFRRPDGAAAGRAAAAYGVAMALTFDEFGMWLHLGGSYWQRASVDAVVIVAAALGSIAFFPSYAHFRTRHRVAALFLLLAVAVFAAAAAATGRHLGHLVGPELEELESSSSP